MSNFFQLHFARLGKSTKSDARRRSFSPQADSQSRRNLLDEVRPTGPRNMKMVRIWAARTRRKTNVRPRW